MPDPNARKRLFLRAVLLSEHVILLAAASYHLWVAKDWESHVALARKTMAALFTIAVGVSFLVAMLLAVVMLWLKLPTWIVTLASAILGPVIGAGAMVLIMRAL